jgi:hypothetical protein
VPSGPCRFVKNPISMKEMKQKCNATAYDSIAAFSADIELIRFNAYAYNSPENLGQFGDPVMLPRVETFVTKVKSLLSASAAQLQVSPFTGREMQAFRTGF